MIDTLVAKRRKFRKPLIWDELGLTDKGFIVLTLHRPSNVDDKYKLRALLTEIVTNASHLPVIFPVHPRTKKILQELDHSFNLLSITPPLGYLEFNYLVERSMAVITDSGGITEETTVMGVPCITLRETTERPETVFLGTNELIGTDPAAISSTMSRLFKGEWKIGKIPPLWDGESANRIIDHLLELNI
jgi:UDP-N-acetylglucosamine 2-epimerase (non-hydrolysing)